MKFQVSVVTKLRAMLGLLVCGTVATAALAWQYVPEADRQAFGTRAAVITFVVLVLGVLLRVSVRSSIVGSLRAASQVIARVAEGDLTVKVTHRSHGETAKMMNGLDRMLADLSALVGEVTRSAHQVATTSAQMAQGHRDLAWRTEQQASTLEETASSMEELTSTVQHNADNAREASQLARTAADVAARGGQVVADVVVTMEGISRSAGRISEISSVIDGIAFQTNLLALNAAVEAARAGEQGRGFAVVASEVRTLAQRSAAAAKEIKTLIGESVEQVESGHRLVGEAGATMQEVVASVQKVNGLIGEIAAASREQSAGIGQVNTAVAEMEQGVQHNASLVQQAADATAALAEQAGVLQAMVARFRLADAQQRAPERAPTSRSRVLATLPAHS